MRPFRFSLLAAGIVVLNGLNAHAQTGLVQPVALDIPAQPLGEALNQLSAQSGLQIILHSELARGLMSNRLVGQFTPQAALERLLAETGLRYEYLGPEAVAVVRPNDKETGTGSDLRLETSEFWNRLLLAQSDSSPSSSTTSSNEAVKAGQPVNEGRGEIERLEEVIVTAQKREQDLQSVPISISVVSGETLDRSVSGGVLDEVQKVPGVAITPGGNTGSQITIRGVGPTATSFFGSSPAGYYLDSVPFGFIKAAFVPDLGAYDLDRVEVLRGPQGTLYGASSTGGLVRILTKDPNLDATEFKYDSFLSNTRYGGLNFGNDAAVNIPLAEGVVAARLVVGYHDLDGWIDQPVTGRKNANDSKIKTLRFKVKAEPTDALMLKASVWFSRQEDGAPPFATDGRQYGTNIDETANSDFDLYEFDLGYDFGWAAFNSSTSFMNYDFDRNSGTGTGGFLNVQNADVFSEEATLVSTGDGPWRWTLGGIYRGVDEQIIQFANDGTGVICCGDVAPTDISLYSRSYAAYGELTRAFLDGRFELSGGLRYFHDKVYQNENSRVDGLTPLGRTRSRTFNKVSPRVVATWLPSRHFTAYASYSEGFRSGVDQYANALRLTPSLPDADPDNLKNYEIGIKGDLGRILNFEVAAYYQDWRDVQYANLTYDAVIGRFHAVTLNGPSASGPGVDASLTVRPSRHLSLGGTVSWNDLTYDDTVIADFGPFGSAVVYDKGDRLNASPEWTASAWGEYAVPLSGWARELRFSASANYVSERYERLFGKGGPNFTAKPLTTVAARATLELENNLSIAVFADNLTNEQTPISGADPTVGRAEFKRLRPQTVGVQLGFKY